MAVGYRSPRLNKSRRKTQPSLRSQQVSLMPTVVDFTTPNVAMTFGEPVNLKGLPLWLTNTGKLPISASLSSSKLVVTCVYDTPGSVTSVTVPPGDAAVTNWTGARIPAGSFPAA